MVSVGKRLQEMRQACGLSLGALAEKAGIRKRQTIHHIEIGKQRASIEQIEKLAKALGVSPAWLAFGDEG